MLFDEFAGIRVADSQHVVGRQDRVQGRKPGEQPIEVALGGLLGVQRRVRTEQDVGDRAGPGFDRLQQGAHRFVLKARIATDHRRDLGVDISVLAQQSGDGRPVNASGVTKNHRQFGEIAGYRVEQGGPSVPVLDRQHTDVAGVEQHRTTLLGEDLVEGVHQPVIDVDLLHCAVELQPFGAGREFVTKHRHRVRRSRVDRAETDQACWALRDLVADELIDLGDFLIGWIGRVHQCDRDRGIDAAVVH